MPWKAERPCPVPGCPEVLVYGRCPRHEAEHRADRQEREPYNFSRGEDWAKLSVQTLQEEPLCRCGCGRRSVIADHIIPPWAGGAELDRANTQGLAAPCHARKTWNDKRTLTRIR